MTTYDQVLELARQLPPSDQSRLRTALVQEEAMERLAQIARNQAAIAMLDAWAAQNEEDDGTESWEEMLKHLDQYRESSRMLYPHLQPVEPE